jgi:hypothetical protein
MHTDFLNRVEPTISMFVSLHPLLWTRSVNLGPRVWAWARAQTIYLQYMHHTYQSLV